MQMHFVRALKRLRVKTSLSLHDLTLDPFVTDLNPWLDDKASRR